MKKVFLFLLSIGFLSMTNFKHADFNDEAPETCCTAYITFEGEPHKNITKCITGTGTVARVLACTLATSAAQAYIESQGGVPPEPTEQENP
jgi:hypothetical protein